MNKLIKDVAGVIRDLKELNLLKEENVTSVLQKSQYDGVMVLFVDIVATEHVFWTCWSMLKELNSEDPLRHIQIGGYPPDEKDNKISTINVACWVDSSH